MAVPKTGRFHHQKGPALMAAMQKGPEGEGDKDELAMESARATQDGLSTPRVH